MKWLRYAIIFLFPLIFFAISLLTLYDYGVNWDSLQHFVRGQIYYRYLTTGKKDFTGSGKSYYETTVLDFPWTEKMTIGHPPLTDILLAASNHLFYQKLGITGDIQGYHIYIVLITFFMACIVAVWSYQLFGWFASAVSVVALYSYPLLFAEQHFNQKDPAVAAYFTGFMYFLWLGITKKKVWSIVIAAIFAGLSLGTKFNILFAVPIVGLWLLSQKLPRPVIPALISVPVIAFLIFFATYPALWSDPLYKVISVINYYRDIGGPRCFYPPFTGKWFWECSDFHTIRLYVTTLPIPTVLLSLLGMVWAVKSVGKYRLAPLLWFIWFVVTLGRATLPITSLYGGSLRQIMEFIPAAALLSGFGAVFVRDEILRRVGSKPLYISLGILLCYIPVIFSMIRLHPNENLYYNVIAGGLKGAVEKNFPVATNTYGNGYKQAIDWVNANVPNGSDVYLAEGITSAVPSILFRPDIHYKGTAPPIRGHDGGYLIELNEPGMNIEMYHNMRFLRSFFRPIREITVDGTAIAYVWKNDREYIKNIPSLDSERSINVVQVTALADDEVVLDLGSPVILKRIGMQPSGDSCNSAIDEVMAFISGDGIHFTRILEDSYRTTGDAMEASLSVGAGTRFIKIYSYKSTTCRLSTVRFSAFSY